MSNKVQLSGRITSDIERHGSDEKTFITFTLVTSETKYEDGKPVKKANGYNDTYDEFHKIKVFGGLAKVIYNHKVKGDKLIVWGSIRYSTNEHNGKTYYNCDIVANEVEFI